MVDELPKDDSLSGQALFCIYRAVLEKQHEFRVREIEDHIARLDEMTVWERALAQGRWLKMIDLLFEVEKVFKRRYGDKRGELRLIQECFGDELNIPDTVLPSDVNQRLEWYQRRVARDFKQRVQGEIENHQVQSPVEQIFLIEWKFSGMEERYGVVLKPQHEVACDGTNFRVDFAVFGSTTDLRLAIEIDGHDFHEKTKVQVAADKARERAIVRAGYQLLRFTGSEVVKDARKCVEEVGEVIRPAA